LVLARNSVLERGERASLAPAETITMREQIDRRNWSQRAAFTLRHYEGRSIDEIGAALGLGTSAAKHSVFRAVKKLRVALAPLRSQES
jgi:DNA-directed RNA polymerase specialized sigma24 family protein